MAVDNKFHAKKKEKTMLLTQSLINVIIKLNILICLDKRAELKALATTNIEVDRVCCGWSQNLQGELTMTMLGKNLTKGELHTWNNHQRQNCIGKLVSRMPKFIQTFDDSMIFTVFCFRFKYLWNWTHNSCEWQLHVMAVFSNQMQWWIRFILPLNQHSWQEHL